MAIQGFRMDIWLIIWFMAMGMVNYMGDNTNYFNTRIDGKYDISEISGWQGASIGEENLSSEEYVEHQIAPEEEGGLRLIDTFGYVYKAGKFMVSTLWRSTLGLHTYLYNSFGIPYMPWGIPIMIMVNFMNFLGLIELFTKIKAV